MPGLKIVMGCFEVPGFGGASTSNYALFRDLQALEADITWINLIPQEQADALRETFGETLGNPESLPNVINLRLQHPPFSTQPELKSLMERLRPDILVGCHFIAAKLFHQEAAEVPLVFVTGGCRWVQEVVPSRFECATSLFHYLARHGTQGLPPVPRPQEEAFTGCVRCLTHTPKIAEILALWYPEQKHKIHPETCWAASRKIEDTRPFVALARAFLERDIDLLFVSSDWARPVKNVTLASEVAKAFPSCHTVFVGRFSGQRLPGVRYTGLLPNKAEVFRLMGRSKVVVSTSCWDAAPGVLYEAATMGCNVVASKNCGNWSLCHPELLVKEYETSTFVTAVKRALTRPFEARLEPLLGFTAEKFLSIVSQL
jgi:glycosyltransferase involved in cell wall biosynthesis